MLLLANLSLALSRTTSRTNAGARGTGSSPCIADERGKSASHYVGGSFVHGDDLIRAWYLTNGSDVALVSYLAEAASGDAAVELAEAGTIVRSIDFD